MDTTTIFKYEMLEAQVGGMSLIGTGNSRPVSWGNYFWLKDGTRIANFWAENLEAAVTEFNLGNKIRVRVYETPNGRFGLIDDDRIPQDWYYHKLCFTGGHCPSTEILKDMFEYSGTIEELERYTDIVSYYKKQGQEVTVTKNGNIMIHKASGSTTTLLGYKGKTIMDDPIIDCPKIPELKDNTNVDN